VWLRENWLRVVFALVGVLLLTVGYFRLEQEVRTNAAQNRREEQANVLLHEQDRAIRAEGRKRCLVIKALIDYAAPADPVTLPIRSTLSTFRSTATRLVRRKPCFGSRKNLGLGVALRDPGCIVVHMSTPTTFGQDPDRCPVPTCRQCGDPVRQEVRHSGRRYFVDEHCDRCNLHDYDEEGGI
jgi:hypothetical protein